jgi:glucosyl-3-phosphoglycerate synthase
MVRPAWPSLDETSQELDRRRTIGAWRSRRGFTAGEFPLERLLEAKQETISVLVPAREEAATIGQVIETLNGLHDGGLIDEVVVIDAASRDATAALAAERGARVLQEDSVLPQFGPARGKGDAMWRGLAATTGDLVVYVDGDTEHFDERFVLGLLGPLLLDPEIDFVKGCFARPLRHGGQVVAGEGGRVTELVARPLLNLYAPELCVFDQPLAGEVAARRSLLEGLPFSAGYGVEVAMLVDVWRAIGLERMAQVNLGTRQNRHQSLRELSAMAYAVMIAATARASPTLMIAAPVALALPPLDPADPMELRPVTTLERPPLDRARRQGWAR